ncbi:hypothetical protein F511_21254 [Dorcoceras hygrometricum]|uniref:Uncharacterized protein n=1 Tax=Dorcoceras hygrometricum TaxID=472368 RepID=A0A2Z7D7W5_9LAMI|nr:hypothetical protein F511_21254 [Dorcoceras hygrometricum]
MRSVVASHGPGSNPRGPNQTLEEISRHDIAGASPERRPAGGAATTKLAAAARATTRQAQIARPARIVRRSWRNRFHHGLPSRVASKRSRAGHRRDSIVASVRPAAHSRQASSASIVQPAHDRRGDSVPVARQRPRSMHNTPPNIGATSRNDCKKRRPSMRGQRACTARVYARGGAPPCAAAIPAGISIPFFVSILKNKMLDTIRHTVLIRSENLGSDTTVRIRITPPGGAAEERKTCITDSACKNQLVVVSVQYGPFNPYIPIRSTTIGKSRVAIDPIAMHTSWKSNSDIASVTSIGYPRMSASGESSTKMHRLLHASGSHPIPTSYDPKTNQYNQDLGLFHSTNGNHLESPNEGSSIDHQVTIYLHAQNITMFPTNETRCGDGIWNRWADVSTLACFCNELQNYVIWISWNDIVSFSERDSDSSSVSLQIRRDLSGCGATSFAA